MKDFPIDVIFHDVQVSGIFPDSKTFADAIPLIDRNEILRLYLDSKKQENFDLKSFVETHFQLPGKNELINIQKSKTASEHIKKLWPKLERQADKSETRGSLLPLPYPYIVPGGRFREIYYWDSYFTMLGLAQSGKIDTIENMVKNFAYMIENIGFIPNGNRTYFLSRSQPPFFSLMVSLLVKYRGIEILSRFKNALITEYQFWMKGQEKLKYPGNAIYRRVLISREGWLLNRYWDDTTLPRPESYLEDMELADNSEQDEQTLYRHLRAACESGWDFSSRWLKEADDLSTIRTTDLLPIDLNCLLYHLEATIGKALDHEGEYEASEFYHQRKESRAEAMNTYFWDHKEEMFSDYDLKEEWPTSIPTLAMVYPLFFELASQFEADKTAEHLEQSLLEEGGLLTTINYSGQQWDAPNGWAPLQWMAIIGLKNYGFDDLADLCKKRWLALNEDVYQRSGKMMEKYNVADLSLSGGGGEYPNQDGFGWTNGVFLALSKLT
jgi:alpha,alpha-trehalase